MPYMTNGKRDYREGVRAVSQPSETETQQVFENYPQEPSQ